MTEIKNVLLIIVVIVALLLGGFFFGKCSSDNEQKETWKTTVTTDTIYKWVAYQPDTIHIEGPTKTVYQTKYIDHLEISEIDSLFEYINSSTVSFPVKVPKSNLYLTPPFVASLDTITKDTACIAFSFPDMYMKMNLKPRPDSVLVKYITKEIIVEKPLPKAWHENIYVRFVFGATAVFLGSQLK